MYSESDLQSAVEAGVMPAATAEAFRNHVAAQRRTPIVDEENFRLLTGFNDIFVVIAIAVLLVALGGMAGGAVVAAASWGLAEFFTRKRRMALPSIVLLLTFVGGVFMAVTALLSPGGYPVFFENAATFPATTGALVGIAVVAAATAHWFRFRVPITIAAGALSFVLLLFSVLVILVPALRDQVPLLLLAGGLAIFTFAMHWDMTDRDRRTRRSDVAFWLHLAAAPMIAHPIFAALGVFSGSVTVAQALVVVLLYLVFACVSLAVDRRALLVSSLAYVLYAIAKVFDTFGVAGLSAALTGLVIGSALLALSAFWHPSRRLVMAPLPASWKARLPSLDQPAAKSA